MYTRERSELQEIGLTTMAVTQDLHSGMLLVLINKNSSAEGTVLANIRPEPGQPSAQLSQLICPIACKKTVHAMSRW